MHHENDHRKPFFVKRVRPRKNMIFFLDSFRLMGGNKKNCIREKRGVTLHDILS